MNSSELLSKTISFLRFPLIVGVVFIHTELTDIVLKGNNIFMGGGSTDL